MEAVVELTLVVVVVAVEDLMGCIGDMAAGAVPADGLRSREPELAPEYWEWDRSRVRLDTTGDEFGFMSEAEVELGLWRLY